jgi:hypothetical protein
LAIAGTATMGGATGCSSDDPAGDDDDGDGGAGAGQGGSGSGNAGPGPASGSGTPSASTGGPASTGAGGNPSGGGVCDDLPCSDMDMDPDNDCQGCALIGSADASDAGVCNDELVACQGTPNMACLNINTCVGTCPTDNPATADVNEQLDCLCTHSDVGGMELCNEEMDPPTNSEPGTCFGDNPGGAAEFLAVIGCVFGTACAGACAQ